MEILMVNLRPKNEKLAERGVGILEKAAGLDRLTARKLLAAAGGRVPVRHGDGEGWGEPRDGSSRNRQGSRAGSRGNSDRETQVIRLSLPSLASAVRMRFIFDCSTNCSVVDRYLSRGACAN